MLSCQDKSAIITPNLVWTSVPPIWLAWTGSESIRGTKCFPLSNLDASSAPGKEFEPIGALSGRV